MVASFCCSPPSPTVAASYSPRSQQLKTYIVLTAKSALQRKLSNASTASSSSDPEDEDPDSAMAYESYAAVATRRGAPSWGDLNRPRLYLGSLLATKGGGQRKPSQRARRRGGKGGGNNDDNGVIEYNGTTHVLDAHALAACLEFLPLEDLLNACLACVQFRDVITTAPFLLMELYRNQWMTKAEFLPRAFAHCSYRELVAMCMQRAHATEYPLTTRSAVTSLADGTYAVVNDSMLRSFARGAIDSVRGVRALPVLPCAAALKKRVAYYEATMKGFGSVGLVSLSDEHSRNAYGFGSEEHVGWKPLSFGYHGNDGDFVFHDGSQSYGGDWTPFGPAWGAMDGGSDPDAPAFVVGCGYDMDTRELFFTLNGAFVGVAPVKLPPGEYAAAVSMHSYGDGIGLNAGAAPFRYPVECYCASP